MGQRHAAEADWKEVQRLLEKWKDVRGSAELKAACEEIMSPTLPDGNAAG